MKYYFLVNPAAGKTDCTQQILQKIKDCNLSKDDYVIYQTKCKGDATQYVKNLAKSGEQAVVFAGGGDGTLFEVINGMGAHSNLILGVMPFGSGNDFIKSYTDKETALDLRAQLNGDVVSVDLMQSGSSYSIGIASIGFDADVAYNVADFKRLPFVSGGGAYILSILKRFFGKMSVPITVTLDDKEVFSGDSIIGVVANGKYYGAGFLAAPHADIKDGMLEVLLVKKINRLQFIRLVMLYQKGKHMNGREVAASCQKFVTVHRCKKCRITSDVGFTRNLDGECAPDNCLDITLIEGGIKLLIPKKAAL